MVMIVFALICIAMMFLMMRGGPMHRHRRQDAVEILKERFARGEINQAEYEERRRMLQT
jgi:putative membrane protein